MRYVSIFSGIEAASVAWASLGWEPICFSEIEPFPCAVLRERFPGVPNLDDITQIDWKGVRQANGPVDLVVGGSPCQSFSIAGDRTGLDGTSGLMWEYVRCVRELMPRWLLWENVPGALSSGHGEDFRCLLEALDALGYGLAWRVLDAQFFGLAQRRERVFLVGRLGDVEGPCEVLLEPESLSWDTPTSREKRQELAAGVGGGAEAAGFRWNAGGDTALSVGETSPTVVSSEPPAVCSGFRWHQGSGAGAIGYEGEQSPTLDATKPPAVLCIPENAINRPSGGTNGPMAYGPQEPSPTLRASKDVPAVLDLTGGEAQASRVYSSDGIAPSLREHDSGGNDLKVLCMAGQMPNAMVSDEVCGTITAHEARGGVDRMRDAIGFAANQRGEVRLQGGDGSVCGAIPASQSGKQVQGVTDGYAVLRLTPRECERLQGFPDDWTKVPYRGKPAEECPNTPRYRAIGNSMAVPVMRWIGERIQMVEEADV